MASTEQETLRRREEAREFRRDVFVINDIDLHVPPTDIDIRQEDLVWNWRTLRTKSSTKVPSGNGQIAIHINIVFSNSMLMDLVRLIVQFRHSPFCYIENRFLRESIVPDWPRHQNMAFTMTALNVVPLDGSPDTWVVQLDLTWFNYFPYLHNFLYREDWNTKWLKINDDFELKDRFKYSIGWKLDEDYNKKHSPSVVDKISIDDIFSRENPSWSLVQEKYARNKQKTVHEMEQMHDGEVFDLLPLPDEMEDARFVPTPTFSRIYKRYINYLQRDHLIKHFGFDIEQALGIYAPYFFEVGEDSDEKIQTYALHAGPTDPKLADVFKAWRSAVSQAIGAMLKYNDGVAFHFELFKDVRMPQPINDALEAKQREFQSQLQSQLGISSTPGLLEVPWVNKDTLTEDPNRIIWRQEYRDGWTNPNGKHVPVGIRPPGAGQDINDLPIPSIQQIIDLRSKGTNTGEVSVRPASFYLREFGHIAKSRISNYVRGSRQSRIHYGTDFSVAQGTPIYAVQDGEIGYIGGAYTSGGNSTQWRWIDLFTGDTGVVSSAQNASTREDWAASIAFKVDGSADFSVSPPGTAARITGSSMADMQNQVGRYVRSQRYPDRVYYSDYKDGGNTLKVIHKEDGEHNSYSYYMHLETISQDIVDAYSSRQVVKVKAGQILGTVGSTSPLSKPYLKWAIEKDEQERGIGLGNQLSKFSPIDRDWVDAVEESIKAKRQGRSAGRRYSSGEGRSAGRSYHGDIFELSSKNRHIFGFHLHFEYWEGKGVRKDRSQSGVANSNSTLEVGSTQLHGDRNYTVVNIMTSFRNANNKQDSTILQSAAPPQSMIEEVMENPEVKEMVNQEEYQAFQLMMDVLRGEGWHHYEKDTRINNVWNKYSSIYVTKRNTDSPGIFADDSAVVTSVSGGLVHIVANLPLLGHEYPTQQHLGSVEPRYMLEFAFNDDNINLEGISLPGQLIQAMRSTLQGNARRFRQIIDSWCVATDTFMTRLLGTYHHNDYLIEKQGRKYVLPDYQLVAGDKLGSTASEEDVAITFVDLKKRTIINRSSASTAPGNPGLSFMTMDLAETNPYMPEKLVNHSNEFGNVEAARKTILNALYNLDLASKVDKDKIFYLLVGQTLGDIRTDSASEENYKFVLPVTNSFTGFSTAGFDSIAKGDAIVGYDPDYSGEITSILIKDTSGFYQEMLSQLGIEYQAQYFSHDALPFGAALNSGAAYEDESGSILTVNLENLPGGGDQFLSMVGKDTKWLKPQNAVYGVYNAVGSAADRASRLLIQQQEGERQADGIPYAPYSAELDLSPLFGLEQDPNQELYRVDLIRIRDLYFALKTVMKNAELILSEHPSIIDKGKITSTVDDQETTPTLPAQYIRSILYDLPVEPSMWRGFQYFLERIVRGSSLISHITGPDNKAYDQLVSTPNWITYRGNASELKPELKKHVDSVVDNTSEWLSGNVTGTILNVVDAGFDFALQGVEAAILNSSNWGTYYDENIVQAKRALAGRYTGNLPNSTPFMRQLISTYGWQYIFGNTLGDTFSFGQGTVQPLDYAFGSFYNLLDKSGNWTYNTVTGKIAFNTQDEGPYKIYGDQYVPQTAQLTTEGGFSGGLRKYSDAVSGVTLAKNLGNALGFGEKGTVTGSLKDGFLNVRELFISAASATKGVPGLSGINRAFGAGEQQSYGGVIFSEYKFETSLAAENSKLDYVREQLAEIADQIRCDDLLLDTLGLAELYDTCNGFQINGGICYPDIDLPFHPYYGDEYSVAPDFYMWNIYDDGGAFNADIKEELTNSLRLVVNNAFTSMERMQSGESSSPIMTEETMTEVGINDQVGINVRYNAEGSDSEHKKYGPMGTVFSPRDSSIPGEDQFYRELQDASDSTIDLFNTHLESTLAESAKAVTGEGTVGAAAIAKLRESRQALRELQSTNRNVVEAINVLGQNGDAHAFRPSGIRLSAQEGRNGIGGGIHTPRRTAQEKYDELETKLKDIEQMFGSRSGFLNENISSETTPTLYDRIKGTGAEHPDEYAQQFDRRSIGRLAEESSRDLLSKKMTLRRAYPTFKLFFIEEDEFEDRLINFDDFHSYNAVKEFSVVMSRKMPADHATIVVQNVSGTLDATRRDTVSDLDYFSSSIKKKAGAKYGDETSIKRGDQLTKDTTADQPFGSLALRPGLNVQLRCGYSNDPRNLHVMISGRIVDVNWNISGDLAEILVQSFGTELIQSIKGTGRGGSGEIFYTTHELLGSLMLEPEIVHFGRWEFGQIFQRGESKDYRLDFYDYSKEGYLGRFRLASGVLTTILDNPLIFSVLAMGFAGANLIPGAGKVFGSGAKTLTGRLMAIGAKTLGAGRSARSAAYKSRYITGISDTAIRGAIRNGGRITKGAFEIDPKLIPGLTRLPPGAFSERIRSVYQVVTPLLREVTKARLVSPQRAAVFGKRAKELIRRLWNAQDDADKIAVIADDLVALQSDILQTAYMGSWFGPMKPFKQMAWADLGTAGFNVVTKFGANYIFTTGDIALRATLVAGAIDILYETMIEPVTAGIIGRLREFFSATEAHLFLSPQDDNLYPPHPKDYMSLNKGVLESVSEILGAAVGGTFLGDPETGGRFAGAVGREVSQLSWKGFVEGRWLTAGFEEILMDKTVDPIQCQYQLVSTNVWSVFHEMTLRHPGWIYGTRPYGNKFQYTMFFGIPSQRYWSKPAPNRFVRRMNELDNFLRSSSNEGLEITEQEYVKLYGPTMPDGKSLNEFREEIREEFRLKSAESRNVQFLDPNAAFPELNTYAPEDEINAAAETYLSTHFTNIAMQEYLRGLEIRFVPFRKYHVFSSERDIIMNGIIASENAVVNAVDVTYFPMDTDHEDPATAPIGSALYKAHAFIPEHQIRTAPIRYPNCKGYSMSMRYGMGELLHRMRDMYRGEILLVGNPRIRPWDIGILVDTYNDMSGPVEVEQVVHTFSHETGFITEVKPSAVVFGNEISSFPILEGMKMAAFAIKDIEDTYAGIRGGFDESVESDGLNKEQYKLGGLSTIAEFIASFGSEDMQRYYKDKYDQTSLSQFDLEQDVYGGSPPVSPLADDLIQAKANLEIAKIAGPVGFAGGAMLTAGAAVVGLGGILALSKAGGRVGNFGEITKTAAFSSRGISATLLGIAGGGAYGSSAATMWAQNTFQAPSLAWLLGAPVLFLSCLREDSIMVVPIIKGGHPVIAGLSYNDPSMIYNTFKGNLRRWFDDKIMNNADVIRIYGKYGSHVWRRLPDIDAQGIITPRSGIPGAGARAYSSLTGIGQPGLDPSNFDLTGERVR
jgi:murein DD-endopeptidase MepM/ murein hydrolase activator NlpD